VKAPRSILLGSMLLPALVQAKVPPLPADPEVVHTFEAETYDEAHRVGPPGSRSLRMPLESGWRTCVLGTTFEKGIAGQCVRFRSTEDAVEVLSTPRLDKASTVTASAWVKVDEVRSANYIVSKEDWEGGKERGFVLRLTGNGELELTVGSRGWHECRGPKLNLGEWRHVVGTAGERSLALWVDGKQVASLALPAALEPSSQDLTIGRGNYDKKRGFAGSIDEVAVYDRVLSRGEIEALYRRGKAGEPLAVSGLALDEPGGRQPKGGARSRLPIAEEGLPNLHWGAGGRSILILGSIYGENPALTFRAGSGLEFGEPRRIELPALNEDCTFNELDSVLDAKGSAHVFLREGFGPNSTDVREHYLEVSADGEVSVPWFNLTTKLGLDTQAFPAATFRPRGGGLGLLASGKSGEAGTFVVAHVSRGSVRVLRQTPLPKNRYFFSLVGSYGQPIGASPETAWLVDRALQDLQWVRPADGRRTLWFRAGTGAQFAMFDKVLLLGAPRGFAYAAASVSAEPASGAVPVKLLVAKARPGSTSPPVSLTGEFRGDVPFLLLASPAGKVYLLATMTPAERKSIGHLKLWDVTDQPAEAGTIAAVESLNHLAAAFSDERTLQVVFRDREDWYGATWTLGRR
jgi:hypothetical protein